MDSKCARGGDRNVRLESKVLTWHNRCCSKLVDFVRSHVFEVIHVHEGIDCYHLQIADETCNMRVDTAYSFLTFRIADLAGCCTIQDFEKFNIYFAFRIVERFAYSDHSWVG